MRCAIQNSHMQILTQSLSLSHTHNSSYTQTSLGTTVVMKIISYSVSDTFWMPLLAKVSDNYKCFYFSICVHRAATTTIAIIMKNKIRAQITLEINLV